MNVTDFEALVRGKLIVSCQAGNGHPLRDSATIARMAQAAVLGGAVAIRCGGVGGVPDIAAVTAAVAVPVIGLTKDGTEGVYITPSVAAALAVVQAGALVVAADGTGRPRPDGSSLADLVRAVHDAGRLVMADVSTFAEGIAAADLGADIIATTLAGYTSASRAATGAGPDLGLVRSLRAELPAAFIVAEGRYHSPAATAAAIEAGATSVVVGTAITDPAWITNSFATDVQAAANDLAR